MAMPLTVFVAGARAGVVRRGCAGAALGGVVGCGCGAAGLACANNKLSSNSFTICKLYGSSASATATYNREGRQGYPLRIETDPWNLTHLRAKRYGGFTEAFATVEPVETGGGSAAISPDPATNFHD
jgi:hypothetical protein